MTRVVHYINQFFAGLGGEDTAGTPPESRPGPIGPGRKLEELLGDEHELVATVFCGDDFAAGEPGAVETIVQLVQEQEPDLVLAGPAFTSGRYGLACGRVAAACAAAGIPVIASMHSDNPGLEEAGSAPVVASGEAARRMGPSLETLAGAARALLAGEELTGDHGRIGAVPRLSRVSDRDAATRAVELALARLAGDREATEVPLPRFDHVAPAAPVADPAAVTVAILTEGALVPDDNPGHLESARATRWLRYPLEGVDTLAPGEWRSVHGGFSTVWANEDPHRILPLDVARELEREGRIGTLFPAYLVTAGNGTSVGNARRFGIEWAADLHHSEVRAAVLTST
jgi:glycine reductase complex component B subunit gamma